MIQTKLQQEELQQFLTDVSKMLHYESAYMDSKKRTQDGCRQDKERMIYYKKKVRDYLKKNAKEQIEQPMF